MTPNPSDLLTKISDHVRKHNLLSNICVKLQNDFGLIPCIGVEIEFYLNDEHRRHVQNLILKEEKGKYQYEIDLGPYMDILSLVKDIGEAKQCLEDTYPDINFHPKPFPDDYGSAMHFHINFLKQDGSNYFDDVSAMDHVASSLCHYLIPTFFVFAPDASHYKRYSGLMSPTHVSYGPNNRTVAIRVPDSYPRRLEHRISSPMTDSYLAIFTILNSIYLGLKNPSQIKRYEKIHGNAFDEQYSLETLPQSVEEAIRLVSEDMWV